MTNIVVIAGVIFAVLIVVVVMRKTGEGGEQESEKAPYRYFRKKFFMSRAEHEFYDALVIAVGGKYAVFAQVHLPTLFDHTVKGQNWKAAFSHINRKSVDFVLCDKQYLSPVLGIELDDRSHESPDRVERDGEVERIFKAAGLPLLRIQNHGSFDPSEILNKISTAI